MPRDVSDRIVELALAPLGVCPAVAEPRRELAPPARLRARVLPHRLGRYTLFDHIGKGGMADIYLARAEGGLGSSRLVVIKELLPELAHSPRFAEMLATEAKLASLLSHANVVKVEDLGRDDGALYIAMEYVEGIDLRELLRRCAKEKVPLPVEFSLRVVIETLKGLEHAHKKRRDDGARLGIVHRDVSPSNVLLSFEGEVKVCDFGIARANSLAAGIEGDADGAKAARDKAIEGKAGYMSPEQARGEALDARADVFAAGIILWELLGGRRLYKAKEGESLLDVARRADIPELPARDVPDEERLHAIVRRALEVDRDKRYPGASTMLCELEEYAAQTKMIANPIHFGAWLTEHFGGDVIASRRARERVMQALSRGPVATLLPIEPAHSTPAPADDAQEFAPEEITPSTFAVVDRAELTDEAIEAHAARRAMQRARVVRNALFALLFLCALAFAFVATTR